MLVTVENMPKQALVQGFRILNYVHLPCRRLRAGVSRCSAEAAYVIQHLGCAWKFLITEYVPWIWVWILGHLFGSRHQSSSVESCIKTLRSPVESLRFMSFYREQTLKFNTRCPSILVQVSNKGT